MVTMQSGRMVFDPRIGDGSRVREEGHHVPIRLLKAYHSTDMKEAPITSHCASLNPGNFGKSKGLKCKLAFHDYGQDI